MFVPLSVTYLMATMTLGTLSICMTVLVLNIHHRGPRYQIPSWVRRLVLCYLARLVCIKTSYGRTATPSSSPCPAQTDDVWKRRSRRLSSSGGVDGQDFSVGMDSDSNSKPPPLHHLPHRTGSMDGYGRQQQHRNGPVLPSSSIPFLRAIQRRRPWVRNCDKLTKDRQVPPNGSGGHWRPGDRSGGSTSEEWHELAHVLDRVFFWLLFALMTLSAVFILLYPYYSGN